MHLLYMCELLFENCLNHFNEEPNTSGKIGVRIIDATLTCQFLNLFPQSEDSTDMLYYHYIGR